MDKHTPGPWKWWTSNSWRRLKGGIRSDETNVLYPYNSPSDGHPDCAVSEADMALIAAAPEMLAALQLALEAMNHMGDVLNDMDAVEPEDEAATTPAFDAVRAAIARARGAAPAGEGT